MPDEIDQKTILLDLDVDKWLFPDTQAYQDAVGVNPEYAWGLILRVMNESMREILAAQETSGADDYIPLPLLTVNHAHVMGFAWMAARRESPGLTFDEFSAGIVTGDLMSAFYDLMIETVKSQPPLARKVRRKAPKSSAPSTSGSASAGSTGGPSETSTT